LIAPQQAQPAPPPFTDAMRHGMSPEPRHDEIARFNFIGALGNHVATRVFPGNRLAYEERVRPAFEAQHGRPPANRQEVRRAMAHDEYYQFWSGLRRLGQEMRQENGRTMVLRQLPSLIERAKALNEGSNRLQLDPDVKIPRYLSAVDVHCMPGGYHTEVTDDDVASAANYDLGLFISTAGLIGKWTDGAGRALLAWLRRAHPEFKPRRILDLGTGVGHNIVPFALAFPDAEIVAVDVAAPMLRYAHARARSMGVDNITFRQADAEATGLAADSFDLITTSMFFHETSAKALPAIMREMHRVQAPGGLNISLEQPPYRGMSPYDAFIRDWDSHNNNEPFWTTIHDLSMMDCLERAGFDKADCFETDLPAVLETTANTVMDQGKDFGRGALWYGFGARKG
jgi:ubiquinone/menaquinone biosynthesis C-methylase UbiE